MYLWDWCHITDSSGLSTTGSMAQWQKWARYPSSYSILQLLAMLHSRSGSTDTLWVTSRGLGFSSLTAYNSTMVPPKPRTPIGSHTLQVECNNRCAATTITHTTVLRLCGICPGQPGWAGTWRNIHPQLATTIGSDKNHLWYLLTSALSILETTQPMHWMNIEH